MRFKRLLALLLAAALALSLLAGCGGKNQSLAQVILNLLDGQYTNVTVEIDPDLEAALRKAVSQAETEEEIRAALEKLLGSGVSFRLIGDGQKGDSAWNLILYPGSDPDAAARSAYLEWDKIFSAFPSSGLYTAKLSMIETENGYAILVQATVDKAARRNDDDDDDDDEPEKPYSVNLDDDNNLESITVNTDAGFQEVLFGEVSSTSEDEEEEKALEAARNSGFEKVTIELAAGSYSVSEPFTGNNGVFLGTLKGESPADKATITLTGGKGLFEWIGQEGGASGSNGKVENITFKVEKNIIYTNSVGNIYFGAVAGRNYGTISNCDVKLNSSTIQATRSSVDAYAGGLVGENRGTITSCTVAGAIIKADGNIGAVAGGLVGRNNGGEITNCTVTGAAIIADSNGSGAMAGGLVGDNNGGKITGSCKVKDTSVTAQTNSMGAFAGGLVGRNIYGTVTGTYTYTGSGTLTAITGWERLDKYYKYIATVSVPNSENSYTNTVGDGETDMAYAGTGIGCDFTSKPQGPQPADNHKTINP